MEPEGSLTHSQVPATCLYSEPEQSNPCVPIQVPEDPHERTPSFYAWVFQLGFSLGFLAKTLYSSLRPYVLHVPFFSVQIIKLLIM
jgi:hypothetical protein